MTGPATPLPPGPCEPPGPHLDPGAWPGLPDVGDLTARIATASARVGRAVAIDGRSTLTERVRLEPGRLPPPDPTGRTSRGGACRLLPAADGWVAVSLARPDDWAAAPAWLGVAGATVGDGGEPTWPAVAAAVEGVAATELVRAATIVDLPAARLGERRPDPTGGVAVHPLGTAPAERTAGAALRVVDLSALWAGPLVGAVLAAAGAEVVKVEAAGRPDASRLGSPALHQRLNGAKVQWTVDLTSATGRAELADRVAGADVVVTSGRRRALEQLGLDPFGWVASTSGPTLWVSITGYGLDQHRVAFGDDAAVAGGLVLGRPDEPRFCGDAIADPLSGLTAAALVLELLAEGRRAVLDVAMAGVAASRAVRGGPARRSPIEGRAATAP